MSYYFTKEDFKVFSDLLGKQCDEHGAANSWSLSNADTGQSLVMTIYNEVSLGKDTQGNLISVQTQHGYFELHDCTGYMIFEPDEVIFVQYNLGKVSCLIIGKMCNCSLFSNIRRELLNADFAQLDPAVLMAAMQLSLTESILDN